MLDSIYHMTLKLFKLRFCVKKMLRFCHINVTLLQTLLHSLTNMVH